jgi:vacuolar-type H+-ATPase subunit H
VSSSDRTVRRREIEDSTAARLAEIVGTAEKAARQVIDEAEEEARSRLIDAREEADRIVADRLAGLAELTDEISAQAEALRRQSEALQKALAEAKAELGGAESLGGSAPMWGRTADGDADAEPEPAPTDPGKPAGSEPAGPALTVVGSVEVEKLEPRGERRVEPERNGRAPGVAEDQPGFNGAPTEKPTPAGARLLATQMAVSGSSRVEIEERLRTGFAIKDTRAILDAILGPES